MYGVNNAGKASVGTTNGTPQGVSVQEMPDYPPAKTETSSSLRSNPTFTTKSAQSGTLCLSYFVQ
jgi:hypothetical protein